MNRVGKSQYIRSRIKLLRIGYDKAGKIKSVSKRFKHQEKKIT
jgi:hypothetical protein